jgi:hypothetical protein
MRGERTDPGPVPGATPDRSVRIGEVRTSWSSDLCHDLPAHPVLELADGSLCSYLAAIARGGSEHSVRQRLEVHLGDPVDSANSLRLALMRTMREVEPRPHCLAAAVTRGNAMLVAVTHGASAALVRDGRIVERTSDAAHFEPRPGDRLALVCARLDPLVQDADELARIVAADDPHGSAMTLVEIGHLRGGTELSAVVAEVGSPDELPSEAPASEGAVDFADLLAGLAPTLDQHRRTPTPVPRARRTMLKPPPTLPKRTLDDPRPVAAPPSPPALQVPTPTPAAAARAPAPGTDADETDTEPGAPPVSGSLSAPAPTAPAVGPTVGWRLAAGVVVLLSAAVAAAVVLMHSLGGGG